MSKKFTFDEKKHIYYLDDKPLTGVTSVLNVISKPALIGWASKMAVNYIRDNVVVRDGVLEPPLTEEEWEALLKDAQGAHTRKKDDAATKGTNIHETIENLVREAIKSSGGIIGTDVTSDNPQVQKFIDWSREHTVIFHECEKRMYSEDMWLAGTCDFVATVDGKKLVGDIKTTSGIYDLTPFMQCAAYRMMLEEMGEKGFEGSVIVRLGKDGSFEEVYRYDYDNDRRGFIAALTLYRVLGTYKKSNKKNYGKTNRK